MNERSRNDQLVVPPERDEMFPALAPGIDPEDIAPLWLLQSKLPVLEAFMTLFRGSMTDSLVRLLVLGEMGRRGQAPEWTFAELRQTFAYLTPAPLESALRRLRVGGLLRYDATESAYVLTPAGLRVYGAVAALFQLTEEDDLGWITGVVRASYELGTLTPEVLSHLLYRLRRLETELQQAVEALSEPRILQARERLTSIWSWIERGSAMIAQIVQDSALDRELHRVAQQIGRAQSRLLRMTTVFQRVLNDIDRQRVHLGATGLSTSDLVFFLRQCTLDDLGRLIAPHLAHPVRPLFLLTDLITDQAEYELLQRKRHVAEWCDLPEAQDSPALAATTCGGIPRVGAVGDPVAERDAPDRPADRSRPLGVIRGIRLSSEYAVPARRYRSGRKRWTGRQVGVTAVYISDRGRGGGRRARWRGSDECRAFASAASIDAIAIVLRLDSLPTAPSPSTGRARVRVRRMTSLPPESSPARGEEPGERTGQEPRYVP